MLRRAVSFGLRGGLDCRSRGIRTWDVSFRRALQDAAPIEVLEDRQDIPTARAGGIAE